MIYGLISIFYIVLSINEKKLKDNYIKNMLLILSCFFVFCILFCGYIFIDEISPSFIQKNVLTNTKTFFVDSFFKDGFLWSKLLPPFFSIFFFISICMRYMNEIKEKKVSFVTFILLNSIAAFIMEFFAIFSVNTDTFLFISPFLFFLILSGIDGIFYIIELIQIKNTIFSKSNIILGLILFIILYNMFWTFTVAVEKNNNIRAQHSNMYVERFFEK
jgi:hypothetical protein